MGQLLGQVHPGSFPPEDAAGDGGGCVGTGVPRLWGDQVPTTSLPALPLPCGHRPTQTLGSQAGAPRRGRTTVFAVSAPGITFFLIIKVIHVGFAKEKL